MPSVDSLVPNHPVVIAGVPRSGTSLLSVIIDSLPNTSVLQDSGIFFYLKQAAVLTHLSLNNIQDPYKHLTRTIHAFDLRETYFFSEFLNSSPLDVLNQGNAATGGMLLRSYISRLDKFWFEMYNLPDPRKDRCKGEGFLNSVNIQKLVSACDVRHAIRGLHEMLHSCIGQGKYKDFSSGATTPIMFEKTPENLLCLDLFDLVYPEGYKFIGIVRDPVAVYGARRQRIDYGVDDFVAFFKLNCLPTLDGNACIEKMYIKYEDLVADPCATSNKIQSFINPSSESVPVDFQSLNPGSYVSYVGSRIDLERDHANRQNVSQNEASEIKDKLRLFYEAFGY